MGFAFIYIGFSTVSSCSVNRPRSHSVKYPTPFNCHNKHEIVGRGDTPGDGGGDGGGDGPGDVGIELLCISSDEIHNNSCSIVGSGRGGVGGVWESRRIFWGVARLRVFRENATVDS